MNTHQEVWIRAYCAASSLTTTTRKDCSLIADDALEDFNKRFPEEPQPAKPEPQEPSTEADIAVCPICGLLEQTGYTGGILPCHCANGHTWHASSP